MHQVKLQLKSIYDRPEEADGMRVYIEKRKPTRRRWRSLEVQRHEPALAPEQGLVHTFEAHLLDASTWNAYREAYEEQLLSDEEAIDIIRDLRLEAGKHMVTLLYKGDRSDRSNAWIIRDLIEERHRKHEPNLPEE